MKYRTIEALERHVREEDYFAATAAILDLLRRELASRRRRGRRTIPRTIECLQRITDDLLFLQKHYRIVRARP